MDVVCYAASMRLLLAGGHRLPQADAAHQHGVVDMSGLTPLILLATGPQIPVFGMAYSRSIPSIMPYSTGFGAGSCEKRAGTLPGRYINLFVYQQSLP